MGVGEGDDMNGREKDGKRDSSGRKKERKRDRDGREKDREREIGRETGVGESERERQGRKRRNDRGEREKITNTKKIMQFYLVVLYCAERSEARQWILARQVSCYNPLSFFIPVTRDKVGKNDRKRDGLGEIERERERYN